MISIFRGRNLFLLLVLGVTDCSPLPVSTSECDLVPHDQKGSFMAGLSVFPTTIQADSAFNESERKQIGQAVDQWNRLGHATIGRNIFELSFSSLETGESEKRLHDPENCLEEFGTESSFVIVREASKKNWESLGLNSQIPGATFRCENGGKVVRQIVYVKPDLVASVQVGTVVLHELGHAIGLDHSCQASPAGGSNARLSKNGKAELDFVSCMKVPTIHPYREAVMFPSIRMPDAISRTRRDGANHGEIGDSHPFNEGPEVKEKLQENDWVRARCRLSTS